MKKEKRTYFAYVAALVACCILVLCLLPCFAWGLCLAIGGSMEMVPTAEQMEKAVLVGVVLSVGTGLALLLCIALLFVLGKKVTVAGRKMGRGKALSRETAAQPERNLP